MNRASEFYGRLLETVTSETDPKIGLIFLRQHLEALYKDLCSSQDRFTFSNLHARMQFIHKERSFPADIVTQANDLRILCNKVAHDEVTDDLTHPFTSGVLVLKDLIGIAYEDTPPEALILWLKEHNAKPFPKRAPSKKFSFHAVVDGWSLIKNGNEESGINLSVCDEDGNQRSIALYNDPECGHEGRKWSLLARCLWQHALISCRNLTQASSSESNFISNPTTMIILEPDFLIDASSLSECFSNEKSSPEYYLLTRLFSESSTDKMVLGQTVNNIFDEMITTPGLTYNSLFRNSLASSPIGMVSLGVETALDIYRTIEAEHLPQIKQFVDKLGNPEIQLEPSFICPDYGLQGRLDLLYKADQKYHIVELKSGKAPARDTWKAQHMQVTAYNMIIRNCYGNANLGGSAIFYSREKNDPLRFIVNMVAMEQDLLMCRNRIVGILHQLSDDPRPFFDYLRSSRGSSDNPIQKQKQESFAIFTSQLTPYEYDWFLEQVRRIVLEIWYVKTGSGSIRDDNIYGHNALWQQSREEKQRSYGIISGLLISSIENNTISLESDSVEDVHNFRQGDIVVLYKQEIPIGKQQIFRGSISELEGKHLVLTVRGGVKNNAGLAGKELWCVEHDVLETMLYTPLSSITTFLSSPKEKRAILMGIDPPGFTQSHSTADTSLSTIISRAKSAKDYFVIQGPPGTGKTSGLLKTYISDLYHKSDKVLLVLSFTNRAVDELCAHLSKADIPFIRTGASLAVTDELMSRKIAGKPFQTIDQIIRENRIWLSTVQSCNSWISDLLRITKVDELIVDEASQIVEPSILGIIARVGKTILTGDQNQLPPITAQSSATYFFQSAVLRKLCYTTYNQSLMERLYRLCDNNGWSQATCMLSTHYRMHDEIAQLINGYYRNRLVSSTHWQKETRPPCNEALLDNRLIWIETPVTLQNHYDEAHAGAIKGLLDYYIKRGEVSDPGQDCGIIAPYRSMIHCLRQVLPSEYTNVTVDTVERFQGSERKIMILTLPLKNSNDLKTLESLSADGAIDRKLNVAVSRSRERLVILGNADLCSVSLHYRNLIDKIKKTGICIPLHELKGHTMP